MDQFYQLMPYVVDLDKPLYRTALGNLFLTGDSEAHKFVIELRRKGQKVDATGDVSAFALYPQYDTMQMEAGTIEDGNVVFVMPPDFYAIPGMFKLRIVLKNGSETVTVFYGEGGMLSGNADNVIDPDGSLPDVPELVSAAKKASEAAAEARDAAQTATEAAESVDQKVAEANAELTERVSQLSDEMDILQDYGWEYGYISAAGTINKVEGVRLYSKLLLCPPNVEVEYIGETDHENVCGISFYDGDGRFISGVTNNGETGAAVVSVSPEGTAFCRISTKESILDQTYYKPTTPVLMALSDRIRVVEKKFGQYIRFTTGGGIRGSAYDIAGFYRATVVDEEYQITLYYEQDGATKNTGWQTDIVLKEYNTPTYLSIRRIDNAAMPALSADNAVIGQKTDGVATNEQLLSLTKNVGYVDCVTGSDNNSGYGVNAALATIQAAIDAGFKKILVREGTYTAGFTLNNATGVQILLNKEYSAFNAETASDNPKIIIDCGNTLAYGADIQKCSDCVFEDIEIVNAVTYGWRIGDGENLKVSNCVAHDCPKGGFVITDTNAEFVNCIAYNIGVMGGGNHNDGFNIHGTGTTNFINCSAWNCEDDGISHHDACHGYIFGGEWYNCGKGGVASPTHGACVDVIGVYSHDNAYGIYAMSDQGKSKGIIRDCVLKDNTVDIGIKYTDVKLLKNIYDTKTVYDSDSTVVEIN